MVIKDFGAAEIIIIGVLEGLFPPEFGLLLEDTAGGMVLTTPFVLLFC